MVKLGIVIPTINRVDLLIHLLTALGNQVNQFETCYIIDNGNQNIPTLGHEKFLVEKEPKNLGVSGSWNKGISHIFNTTDATHVLALNDDIVVGSKQISSIKAIIDNHLDKWFLVGPYYWSVYVISREGALAMEYAPNKYFDEAFFPAYFEDNDFHYRMRLIDETKYLGNIAAFTPEKMINSGSIQKDSSLNARFGENKRYYVSKWGGEPGLEKYKTPFNL